ncbi:hypothetical protein GGI02_004532 [Coemansia sp. RSA 2322]|nr:hypothetical protein GGI02_004532 [Coemansia sp. RSA 2322]
MVFVNLFLARHGQTDANAQQLLQGSGLNGPLSEVGRHQACALAEGLRNQEIDMVVASGLERAIETARSVAKYHKDALLTTDPRLNEISWGKMDGVSFVNAAPVVDPVVSRWKSGDFDAKIEGGESPNDCRGRILAAIKDILQEARAKGHRNVFVCMHGRVLRVLMSTLVDRDLRTMQRFSHTNCCYHQLRVDIDELDQDSSSATIVPEALTFEAVRIDVRDHLEVLHLCRPEAVDRV